jgi:GNAT superfamily N-acetyltransferase
MPAVDEITFEHEYDPGWGDHFLFAHLPGAELTATEGPLDGVDGEKRLPGGDVAGVIIWNEESQGIIHIEVHPALQRQGIATALYRRAGEIAGPVSLENDYSFEGAAWASRMMSDRSRL